MFLHFYKSLMLINTFFDYLQGGIILEKSRLFEVKKVVYCDKY